VGESYHEHVGMLYHQNLYVKQSIGVPSRIATNATYNNKLTLSAYEVSVDNITPG